MVESEQKSVLYLYFNVALYWILAFNTDALCCVTLHFQVECSSGYKELHVYFFEECAVGFSTLNIDINHNKRHKHGFNSINE